MNALRKTATDPFSVHRELAAFNARRFRPGFPSPEWRKNADLDFEMSRLEGEMLEAERERVGVQAAAAPSEPRAFLAWFEALRDLGPGQNDPLFDWLATDADRAQMTWFIRQEVAGEAGFDDLVALTQVKLPARPKLELARNYWDEMGRGLARGMHGPMLGRLADELGIRPDPATTVGEALALGNLLVGLAANRRYAYHSVGALGAIELTAPGRARKVYEGLRRLGLSSEAQRYYLLHSTLDVKHSEAWNAEAIEPLVAEVPGAAIAIAEGALMRLRAGARCFERYRAEFALHADERQRTLILPLASVPG